MSFKKTHFEKWTDQKYNPVESKIDTLAYC